MNKTKYAKAKGVKTMYEFYKCDRCGGEFLVFETIPGNCPFCLSKDHLELGDTYANIKLCMQARSYKKENGRVVNR